MAARPTSATSATQPSAPVREPGCTAVFQIPPSVSAASGAGTDPSPRSANTSAAAESEVAEDACSSPATSHGALPAATSRAAFAVRPFPAAPASTATAVASPALALRQPSGTSTSSARGSRSSARHRRAASRSQGSTA